MKCMGYGYYSWRHADCRIFLMMTFLSVLHVFSWWRHQMKTFSRNWPFVRGIHRSPHKGQWRGALMISLICVWINDWVSNPEAGDQRRYRAHNDVIVMYIQIIAAATGATESMMTSSVHFAHPLWRESTNHRWGLDVFFVVNLENMLNK